MTTSNAFDRLVAAKKAYEAVKAEIAKDGEAAIAGVFDAFMAEHPEVQALCFTAYTPYFNDGDPCVYSVRDPSLGFAPGSVMAEAVRYPAEPWGLDGDRGLVWEDYPVEGSPVRAVWEAARDLLYSMEDLIETCLGDHICVLVDRDGLTVYDLDHD